MVNEHMGILEGKWVTAANGMSIYIWTSKNTAPTDTPTIVFVHGLSVSSGDMMPTAVRLASFSHIYLLDLPGFKKSPTPSHCLNIAELGDALVSWMEAMHLPPAPLVGNSMGCQIIVNVALRAPQCIDRAILVSPTMDPHACTLHQELMWLVRDTPCEPFHLLPVLLREYARAGSPRTLRPLQYAFEDPMQEHFPHVRVPTLVVRDSHDPIMPQQWVEQVTRLVPKSQLVVVKGASHAVNLNSSDTPRPPRAILPARHSPRRSCISSRSVVC